MPLPQWTAVEAFAFAAYEHATPDFNWLNECGNFCARAYGFDYSGWLDAAAQGRFAVLHSSAAPPGALHFWGIYDGSHGHVALQSFVPGWIWSNDLVRPGQIDFARLEAPVTQWGKQYAGWADPRDPHTFALSGGTNSLWSPPVPAPPAPPVHRLMEDDMSAGQLNNGFGSKPDGTVLTPDVNTPLWLFGKQSMFVGEVIPFFVTTGLPVRLHLEIHGPKGSRSVFADVNAKGDGAFASVSINKGESHAFVRRVDTSTPAKPDLSADQAVGYGVNVDHA